MIGYVRVRADKGRSFCLLILLLFPLKKITLFVFTAIAWELDFCFRFLFFLAREVKEG